MSRRAEPPRAPVERRSLSRRSLLGGALAAALVAASGPLARRVSAAPEAMTKSEKPRLPLWIGHI